MSLLNGFIDFLFDFSFINGMYEDNKEKLLIKSINLVSKDTEN